MPDHDLFDLDDAFSSLERDIASLSDPRSPGQAVAAARRRRRTTIGGAVVGLALAVGVAVVVQGTATRDDSVGPAGLPDPAVFDAAALSAATDGWTSGWRTPTQSDSVGLKGSPPLCLGAIEGPVDQPVTPDPARSGGSILATDDEVSLSTLVGWNDDHPDASAVGYAAVVASVGACAQATAAHDYAWDGAQARSWTISVGGKETQHLWAVRTDRAVGVLWAGGSAGPVPDAVDERVTSALVAGLQSSKSFDPTKGSTGGSVSATASASTGPVVSGTSVSTVGDDEFAYALAGWDNGWRQAGGSGSVDQVPCVDNWEGNAPSATGGSLGTNGDQEYGEFASAEEARSAVSLIRKSFASCAGPAYQVTTPPGADPSTALVASGPDVVWVVQHGTTVGVIAIPGGGSAPPAQVTADVMSLMTEAMSHQPQVEATAPAPSPSGD